MELHPPCRSIVSIGASSAARPCLTGTLRSLLVACIELGTDDTVRLAAHLCQAPSTVATNFKRINRCLGTSSRTEAILLAMRLGEVPSPPATTD